MFRVPTKKKGAASGAGKRPNFVKGKTNIFLRTRDKGSLLQERLDLKGGEKKNKNAILKES